MGSTGSTWLAKLLDSHPEVSCSHEAVISQVFPRDQVSAEDVRRFIEYFAWDTKHHAYRTVGDVGSAWSTHLPYLPFPTALLLRHPARVLHTRLRVYPHNPAYFPEIPESTKVCIHELWGIKIDEWGTLDRVFLYDAFTFASQVWAADKVDFLIRIEDMQDANFCHEILHAITGVEYDDTIVATAIGNPVNRSSGPILSVEEIVARFSARQRAWYQTILANVVGAFGYCLLSDPISKRSSACRSFS